MIVAVSDTHLGTEDIGSVEPDREAFKSFLRYLRDSLKPAHLVLNGDIEDLWRRDMRTVTRDNYDVFALLAELRETGTDLHYVLGNHDWYARNDVRTGVRSLYADEQAENYRPELSLETAGTSYTFVHGHQFDPRQDEWYFDKLALITDDAVGATFSQLWALYSDTAGALGFLRAFARVNYARVRGSWQRRLAEMDDCQNGTRGGAIPPGARERVATDPGTDVLCIGHTHVHGIAADGTVANSGAWLGGTDTYLLLEGSPRLLRWNDGEPTEIDERVRR